MTSGIMYLFTTVFLVSAMPVAAWANWSLEQRKIEYLLNFVKTSSVTFVRNGDHYSGEEASDHLRMKLNKAQSSWFAPPKEEWTAVMFIEKVASKSSVSGQPYFVILQNGSKIRSRDWLLKALANFRG